MPQIVFISLYLTTDKSMFYLSIDESDSATSSKKNTTVNAIKAFGTLKMYQKYSHSVLPFPQFQVAVS